MPEKKPKKSKTSTYYSVTMRRSDNPEALVQELCALLTAEKGVPVYIPDAAMIAFREAIAKRKDTRA